MNKDVLKKFWNRSKANLKKSEDKETKDNETKLQSREAYYKNSIKMVIEDHSDIELSSINKTPMTSQTETWTLNSLLKKWQSRRLV